MEASSKGVWKVCNKKGQFYLREVFSEESPFGSGGCMVCEWCVFLEEMLTANCSNGQQIFPECREACFVSGPESVPEIQRSVHHLGCKTERT